MATQEPNVREYFEQTFPGFKYDAHRNDAKTLESMPVFSNCGEDCTKAIDAAHSLVEQVRLAFGNDRPEHISEIGHVVVRVCSCFING